jgi:hypothetical protein
LHRSIPSEFRNCRLLGLTFFLFALAAILLSGGAASAQTAQQPADTGIAKEISDSVTAAQIPQPVTAVTARDNPNDGGGTVIVKWELSPDDTAHGIVSGYWILRSTSPEGPFKEVGDITAGTTSSDDGNTTDGQEYFYKVIPVTAAQLSAQTREALIAASPTAGPVESSAQWFDWRRINVFVGVALLCFFIVFYINQARAGKKLFIRKIAGLEAVDEAVGRATEMGKKIFYIPGTQDMDNVQTIAGVTILGRVAELAAQYETWLEVPVSRSLVMVTAKEMVKEAYARMGRPDAFNEDQVHYLTDDQFGYAAGIDGMVVREKPATIFFMGAFYAESLILAETGNSIGAIQIAGTGMPAQLPFFVAACDYTLIGEELFAASAYLSREPKLLGSLKGQDVGKGVVLVAIVIGLILETLGIWRFSSLFTVIGK